MRQSTILAAWALLLTGVATPSLAASPQKVLGMRVEGAKLSAKDRGDLFEVVQSKLREYPNLELVKPPEAELTDEMMDLECIDIDVDCLTKLGRKYGATRVFYGEVNPKGGGYTLMVRIVDVDAGKALRDRKADVSGKADLAGALEREVEAVFGPPPAPEPKDGMLVVAADVPGAKIFVDGEFAGAGEVRLKKLPGTYSVRVARDGFEERLFQVEVEAGGTVTRRVTMKALPAVGSGELPPEVAPDPPTEGKKLYKKWWFWTIVGVVAVGATTAAVVATSGGDDAAPTGSVVLSVDRADAWRDSAIRARAR